LTLIEAMSVGAALVALARRAAVLWSRTASPELLTHRATSTRWWRRWSP